MDGWIETTQRALNLSCCYDTVSQTTEPPCCAFSKWNSVPNAVLCKCKSTFLLGEVPSEVWGTQTVRFQAHFLSKYLLMQTGGQVIKNYARVLSKHAI